MSQVTLPTRDHFNIYRVENVEFSNIFHKQHFNNPIANHCRFHNRMSLRKPISLTTNRFRCHESVARLRCVSLF